jgi:hypothetical protein
MPCAARTFDGADDLLVVWDNGHVDNGDDISVMMLQNLARSRQARDAVIKEICVGLPSHYTEEQSIAALPGQGLANTACANQRSNPNR